MKRLVLSVLILTLAGCSAVVETPDSALLDEIRGPAGELESTDILAISPELKAFLDRRIDRQWKTSRKLKELRNILFSPDLFAIEYEAGETKTAVETWESRAGNCLSMTNLFIAMARYTGLDARYHLVETRPEWDRAGNTLIWTQHINSTGVLRNGDRYILDFLPDKRPVSEELETISDENALAIYYNNLGAEAIIGGRYEEAIERLRVALKLQPDLADAWNNMGAAQRRRGRMDLALASYQQAVNLDPYSNTAMSNLSRIYLEQGNEDLGRYYAERVRKHRDRNPYYHFSEAKAMIRSGELESARKSLGTAIRLKEDEPLFFETLAEVYAGLGDPDRQRMSSRVARMLRQEISQHSNLEIYRPGDMVLK